jgi:hypothetical protein
MVHLEKALLHILASTQAARSEFGHKDSLVKGKDVANLNMIGKKQQQKKNKEGSGGTKMQASVS